jgi:tetratricopeptide (TPR) repeat protein
MNKRIKIAIYLALLISAGLFVWQFRANYSRLMAEGEPIADTDLINVKVPDYRAKAVPAQTNYHLGAWGAGMVLSIIGLGLLLANDLSHFLSGRATKVLYNEEGEGIANPDYEKAEEEWAKGNFLDAIQLLRDYLKLNPREQHVALRIAEIYEKDLQNYLAAALEYEEVLKQKLPPERWGWAAVHLCNLYSSKLNQPDKAIVLLQRIVAEYGETAAAEKARKRLTQLEVEGVVLPPVDLPAEPAPQVSSLPPGFAPKKL